VPSQLVGLIQALVILFATASAITQNPRLRGWLAGRRRAAS
jgi:simple sugar transport system permease protein